MLKAVLVMLLTGCFVALSLANRGRTEETKNAGPASTESKDSGAKDDAHKQPSEPANDAQKAPEKKKSPFGAKTKAPVGKALLETKRQFVKAWKVDDLLKKVQAGLTNRGFERGKKLFTEAKCILCHTYGKDQGGGFVGPALTDVGARFSAADILSSIIEPSKVIADAYLQKTVVLDDGRSFTGMVAEVDGDVQITQDILDPDRKVIVRQDQVESMTTSKVSPMPEGLLNTLNEDEIFDLIAFVISRNDPEDDMFVQKK